VIRAMGAFGGGLGGNGDVCGAVAGGLGALGLRFSRAKEEELEDLRMWTYTREFLKRFREEIVKNHAGIRCWDIVQVDWTDRAQAKNFYTSGKTRECSRIVGETAKLIGEMIERSNA
jgi:C_GCAxxG_C_C family probable redox protein